MDEFDVEAFPRRTQSKSIRSSAPSKDPYRGERHTKASPTTITTTITTPGSSAHPGLASRTDSPPLVPALRDLKLDSLEGIFDVYNHHEVRGSVTSIKDDPFFRNYQSPHSVSLARELRSVTHSESSRDEQVPKDAPSRSTRRPSVDDTMNLPVGSSRACKRYLC